MKARPTVWMVWMHLSMQERAEVSAAALAAVRAEDEAEAEALEAMLDSLRLVDGLGAMSALELLAALGLFLREVDDA